MLLTVDTGGGVILDAQVDVLVDAETCVHVEPSNRNISTTRLPFPDKLLHTAADWFHSYTWSASHRACDAAHSTLTAACDALACKRPWAL